MNITAFLRDNEFVDSWFFIRHAKANMDWHVDYDQIARTYDRRYERTTYPGMEHALLQFAGNKAGQKILEVGCGTGHWLQILHSNGLHVTGIDMSAEMLAHARRSLSGGQLARGRAKHLPWPAETFDRVFCINALHHFTDRVAFFSEARRVLHQDGMLLTIGLDPHCRIDQWYIYDYFDSTPDIDRQRYPASKSIRAWMQMAGFEHCVTFVVQHIFSWLPAAEALEQGQLDKAMTSHLACLTDEQYWRGIRRIKEQIQLAQSHGQRLLLRTNIRLYGTRGVVRSH